MKCPICKKEVELGSAESPFCSERCRLTDLGNWAMGKYRIPGPPVMPDELDEKDDE
ncbi:MAG: DNA gyrase inhibitor YacG [Bryobacteraceae bacterium]